MTSHAAPSGGPRVRIQDAGAGSSNCSRGWGILQSQWKEFCQKREIVPLRVFTELECLAAPASTRPTAVHDMDKNTFDRNVDQIMAHYTSSSPRSKAQHDIWQRAMDSNNELRQLIGDQWMHKHEPQSTPPPAPKDASLEFFPTEWSNCLTTETLAELVVDAYAGAFVDSFLDGSIALVEVASKMNLCETMSYSKLQQSMSEPSLQKPSANRRLRNSAQADKALMSLGLAEKKEGPSTEGFTMNGLTKDPWDAWNSRNYHKCKPLDPFVKRIEKATQMQRPQRRLTKPAEESPTSQKFVKPLEATHFPEKWEREKPGISSASKIHVTPKDADFDEEPTGPWLMQVMKSGKTTFPYSLVSHRAFLNSLKDPVLRDKASKLAPLKLTTDD